MRVSIGRGEVGPKRKRGDRRTPEGDYAIAGPARESRFHLFIPIDYPSIRDAGLALAEGRLDAASYDRIADAHDRGTLPPQDTPLGGHLGLHGEGESWRGQSVRHDWTFGCIAVTDDEIEVLATLLEPGVTVSIHP